MVGVGFVIDKPTDLSTHFTVASLGGGLEHCQPRSLTLVLPHIAVVLRAGDDVGLGHGEDRNLQASLFAFDSGPYGVAEVDLGDFFFRMGENGAELAFSFDFSQFPNVFHVLLIAFCIPEDHAELHSVCLLVGED